MNRIVKISVLLFITLIIILIPIILYYASDALSKKDNQIRILNPIVNIKTTPSPEFNSKLKEIVDENFQNDNKYAVIVKNFETDEVYKFNEEKEFDAASLYKLWVLGVSYQQIKDGELDPSRIVTGDKNKLDEVLALITPLPTIEGEVLEIEEKKEELISFVIADAIEKMIIDSDNHAALLMTKKVGYRNVENFLEEYNLTKSNFDSPPKTTAEDISHYYESLYNGKIVDREYSNIMINVLKGQRLNDRIPKYLPKEIEIAHKTGELYGAKHDAGIVFASNGDYMIVVLSKTKDSRAAAEKIAKFSEEIYNYFEDIN